MSAALVWFRRDLRSVDHAALSRAAREHARVYCVFVFDTTILDALPRCDRRVDFIHASVVELDAALRVAGGGLIVRHGDPVVEIPALAQALGVAAVYANRDDEPSALARDEAVWRRLATTVVSNAATPMAWVACKDQVIFAYDEVHTQAGGYYGVFTPYKRAWLARLTDADIAPWPDPPAGTLAPPPPGLDSGVPSLAALGFEATDLANLPVPTGMQGAQRLLDDFVGRMPHYADLRDYPARKGPSYLSVHLRFGTVSIRTLVRAARADASPGAQTWLAELIWREFYHMVLASQPRVASSCYLPWADALMWDNAPDRLAAWQQGRTGYPLVDAGMRQLLASGYMHNRLRMVTASFLCKDLGVDWRLGEAWFARWLLDFDLAANNGGWQWSASTGCDAQPWFRMFNPVTQSQRFDPEGRFIRRYVPELAAVPDKHIHAPWRMSEALQHECGVVIGRDYPLPLVDHAAARERTLARYRAATGAAST